MSGGSQKNSRCELGIIDIFIPMVVERNVVSIEGESLKQHIDPAGTVEIIIFEEIDDRIGMQIELLYMFEHAEKRTRLSPLFDFYGLVFDEVVPFSCGIEEKCEIHSRVDRSEKIAVARLTTKPIGPLFVSADGRKVAMTD